MVNEQDIARMRGRLEEIVEMETKKGKIAPKEEREKPKKSKGSKAAKVKRKLERLAAEAAAKKEFRERVKEKKVNKVKTKAAAVPLDVELKKRKKKKRSVVIARPKSASCKGVSEDLPPKEESAAVSKPATAKRAKGAKSNGTDTPRGSFERVSLSKEVVKIINYLAKAKNERKINEITRAMYGEVPGERAEGFEEMNGRKIRNALRAPLRLGLIQRVRDGVMQASPEVTKWGADKALEKWKERQRAAQN